ncbi:ATP-dependent helicase HrpB [Paraurantiacibacter namhicola]|uniref:ATP-dependent RNA helicase HrpB n=1 Tax=Paraurantiacibacter namhicola TaxID=645517 RepID=A0A1C7D9W2_9SPHN|nr:ATP-dependent helicase HrpB [Paraurantiacibacter namhicola]ANU08276.1 ATP-dependent RNA helicase HrpB [Paraurantiacibacter namhicola]
MPDQLPIHAVLPDLLAALRERPGAVLVAPPGAGKTTAVAPALLDEPWCSGTIILTSPRRVAARAAAERMAQMLGEKPGETVGYLTRLDAKRSAKTRILVVTEAIFVSQILSDQELAGISAVLFDEAHERHLDSDLGLALALESQSVLREDLRVLVMSATIDGARFARLLGKGTPVIESEGRAHDLHVEWLGSSPEKRIEDAMASAVLRAWREEEGDILAFLPGVGEIERVRERLEARLPQAPILPLHGQVQPAQQRAAIRRDGEGRRRIVLATAIAETSITLEGVSVVVDSGLSRRAEFDLAAGTTHLITTRASRAAAAQRAGRAARTGPGVAYRLWEEGGHAGRPEFDPPEMLTADLAPLVLSLASWGVADPASLAFLDPPPAPAVATARQRLAALGALLRQAQDERWIVTEFGKQVAALPMGPWQAAMLLHGAARGQAELAAKLALLLQERGLGGRGEDLAQRLQRWEGDRSPRAAASRKLAQGWAKRAERQYSAHAEPVEAGLKSANPIRPSTGSGRAELGQVPPAILLALALPDNIARRRDPSGEIWLSAGGRGYALDPASPIGAQEWLVIGDATGNAKGARITAALPLERGDIDAHLAHRTERRTALKWTGDRAEPRLESRLGAITLASGPDPEPDEEHIAQALVDKALDKSGEKLSAIVPADLAARARFAGIAELSDEALRASAATWLAPLLHGRRDLKVPRGKVVDALLGLVDWDTRQRLDRAAPPEFTSPAGTTHAIDYTGPDAPAVEVRVQALFGLDRHPMVGDTPLLLKLTSPAGRPIQTTRDLPGFWRGSWADVAKDMKGRYPKHRWPEEPWTEKPSLKTKNAFNR